MKTLLYIFILFVFIVPTIGHSVRRGRGGVVVRHKRNELRRTQINPLLLEAIRGLTESSEQIQERLRKNRGVFKTLQEAQEEFNNRSRRRGQNPLPDEVGEIVVYMREHRGPITRSGLQDRFGGRSARRLVEAALEELTSARELVLIRVKIPGFQTAVWARRSGMGGRTPEEMLAYYKKLGAVAISNVEEVTDYVRSHPGPYTLEGIRSHFKGKLSRVQIERILEGLTVIENLVLIQIGIQGYQSAVWARRSEIERLGKTSEEILEFYKESGVIARSIVEEVVTYVRANSGPYTRSGIYDHFEGKFTRDSIKAILDAMVLS